MLNMKVVIIIILDITLAFCLKSKQYKNQKVSSFDVIKELIQPKSYLDCCSMCMNQMSCEGVQFDGTTCKALRNVKLKKDCTHCTQDALIDSELTNPKMTKLLIINAYCHTNHHHKKTEVIDLEVSDNHCTSIDFPHDMCYTTGALIGADLPFFCGGHDYSKVQKTDCYALWKREYIHVTSMNQAKSRSFGNNVVIDGSLVLVAGVVSGSSTNTDKAEMVSLSGTKELPALPKKVHNHCVVKVDDTKIMLIGGYDTGYTDETFIYDFETEAWTPGHPLINGRNGHACARIEVGTKPYIVVAGGYFTPSKTDKVEILDVVENQGWIQGKKMPKALNVPSGVSLGSSMIVSGGINTAGDLVDDMYKFECTTNSIDDCEWKTMEQKLKYVRGGHVSMLIPDSLAKELCSDSNPIGTLLG